MEEKFFCCGICLPALIASDDRTRTVRALGMWETKQDDCRCGQPSEFEMSR